MPTLTKVYSMTRRGDVRFYEEDDCMDRIVACFVHDSYEEVFEWIHQEMRGHVWDAQMEMDSESIMGLTLHRGHLADAEIQRRLEVVKEDVRVLDPSSDRSVCVVHGSVTHLNYIFGGENWQPAELWESGRYAYHEDGSGHEVYNWNDSHKVSESDVEVLLRLELVTDLREKPQV